MSEPFYSMRDPFKSSLQPEIANTLSLYHQEQALQHTDSFSFRKTAQRRLLFKPGKARAKHILILLRLKQSYRQKILNLPRATMTP